MPIVEHFPFVLGEGAIIRYSVLGFETRHAKPPGPVLARKDAIRPAGAIHVAFSGDVKYDPCRVRVYEQRTRVRVRRGETITFDRDVYRFGRVSAVELGEIAERKGVVFGWVEVGSGRLHDRLEGALVVRGCSGDGGTRWGVREGPTAEEVEEG